MNEREGAPEIVRRRRDLAIVAASSALATCSTRAMEAGPFAILAIGVGSVALAALLWNNVGGDVAPDTALQIGSFVLSAAVALVAAFATWLAVGYVAHRRFGWDEIAVLRWDSASFAAFLVFPIARVAGTDAPVAAWATLAAFALAKLLPLSRFIAAVRDVALVFMTTRIIIFSVAAIATAVLPVAPGHAVGSKPFAEWAEWDGAHYLAIARHGYGGTDTAFFPLYPTLLRLGGMLFHSDVVAGVAISNLAFLIGLWYLRDIAMLLTGDERVAGRTLWYLAIFPASLFFTAVYSESVFFALTVATFANLERRNWLFAGMIGGFAALTRLAGVFLIVPFLIEIVATLQANRLSFRENRRRMLDLLACAACIPLALLAFMVLEGLLTGDLLAFEHVQSHWQRALSPPWTSVWRSIELVVKSHDPATVAVQAIELSFTALVVVLIVDGARLLRPSYWWYAVLSFLVPLSTSSLMSVPRFASVVFPLFIVLSIRGENPIVDRIVVALTLPLLGLFTAFFVTGRWVA